MPPSPTCVAPASARRIAVPYALPGTPLALALLPAAARETLGAAMGLRGLAKPVEWTDPAIFHAFGVLSGHTIKHLLATLAAALIVWMLACRLDRAGRRTPAPSPGTRERDNAEAMQ